MPKNKLADLRDHLFETLEALKDDKDPMDLPRAKAVADVARVIVDTAKVEVDFLRVTDGMKCTDFFPEEAADSAPAGLRASPQRPQQLTAGVRR